ncbi:hypothetical protein Tcan_02095 [Toxocara canis]|uniref:Uncharacterized protein n=1 Tax=Toxocara canis TaxID=6265 RepID=A0A0B2US28_TOXCA|nr:hypothetical protein Tcan_02095 [Toxocara canis]
MSLDVPATVSTDVWKSGRPRIRTLSYHSTKGLMSDVGLAIHAGYVDKGGNEGMPDVHYISEVGFERLNFKSFLFMI